jgi:hypothetical protein
VLSAHEVVVGEKEHNLDLSLGASGSKRMNADKAGEESSPSISDQRVPLGFELEVQPSNRTIKQKAYFITCCSFSSEI